MGIVGLLGHIKPALEPVDLRRFKGQRLGVDGNVWLHRGTYACALDLAKGLPTRAVENYCRNFCEMMTRAGVKLLVVFDGRPLPAKEPARRQRTAKRQHAEHQLEMCTENIRELEAQLHEGTTEEEEVREQLEKAKRGQEESARLAARVTQPMVESVMRALRQLEGVEVLRAPYEADAQLAYLARHKKVDVVVTEDSDLVAYKLPRVLLKLDRHSGAGQLFERERLEKVVHEKVNLDEFTDDEFLQLCILCGTDYLESPKGLGVKTAHKWMGRLKRGLPEGTLLAGRVIRHLRVHEKSITVPPSYEQDYERARITFAHQRVWNGSLKKVVPLSEPLPDGFADELDDLIGPPLTDAEARDWCTQGYEAPTPFSFAAGGGGGGGARAGSAVSVQRRGGGGGGGGGRRRRRRRRRRQRPAADPRSSIHKT